ERYLYWQLEGCIVRLRDQDCLGERVQSRLSETDRAYPRARVDQDAANYSSWAREPSPMSTHARDCATSAYRSSQRQPVAGQPEPLVGTTQSDFGRTERMTKEMVRPRMLEQLRQTREIGSRCANLRRLRERRIGGVTDHPSIAKLNGAAAIGGVGVGVR